MLMLRCRANFFTFDFPRCAFLVAQNKLLQNKTKNKKSTDPVILVDLNYSRSKLDLLIMCL